MDKEKFGQRLKTVRKEKGMTQIELAELASIGNKYISNIERGKVSISMDTFMKLVNALQVSPNYLLKDSVSFSYSMEDEEQHLVFQEYGRVKTERLLYMLDSLYSYMRECEND
jgi:transcriptional regulator with XRE-family HTH domain